jgi:acyl carrier protein
MDIFEEVKKIIMEILDLEGQAVTPESLLMQELGAESIDLLELAASLNARFKIEIQEEDIFLQRAGTLTPASYPFLTEQRLQEIAAGRADGSAGGPAAVKVKDLASYVAWQQRKAGDHVHP